MNRERLTITLRSDLLNALDGEIDGEKLRNRSHARNSIHSRSPVRNSTHSRNPNRVRSRNRNLRLIHKSARAVAITTIATTADRRANNDKARERRRSRALSWRRHFKLRRLLPLHTAMGAVSGS